MEKREGTEDRRIRRTRKQIQDAFIALTIEEGFASVTVHSITERADINRSTFYRYYQDKYDLLDALADEVVAEDASVEADEQEAHRGTVQLLGRIQQHAEFYQVMLSVQGDAFFAERFRQNIEKWFRDRFHEQDDPNMPPLDLRIKS